MRRRWAGLLIAGCGSLILSGCLHRTLTIRTDPPGALVYVNERYKGQSPATYDFEWYGWQRLVIRKDGFVRVQERKYLPTPAYLWIPFDLAAELAPFPVRDDRVWSYTLMPETPLPTPTAPPLTMPHVKEPADAAR